MGSSVCYLSACLQILAAIWAFRSFLVEPRRPGWAAFAVGMIVLAAGDILAGLDGHLPAWAMVVQFACAALFTTGAISLGKMPPAKQAGIEGVEHRASLDSSPEALDLAGSLAAVMETADVWINTLDMEARVLLWNPAAERISGYRREDVLGRAEIWSWLYPDEAYRSEVARTAGGILNRGEQVLDFETTIRTKDGEARIISWGSRAIRNEQGQVTGSLAIGRDITEIRKTERDFQRVHALQKLILEHNVLGMAYVRDRRLEWANPRAAELFRIPLDQFIGAPARIIYPDNATYEEVGKRAYATMAKGGASDFRLEMRRANGQFFWCRLVAMAVNPSRPHEGSVWLAEDVSKQVAAESALGESEARLRSAFEGTQDALLLMTLDGIFDCNHQAVELFGFSQKSELFRLQVADLSPARQPGGEDSRIIARKHMEQALKQGSIRFQWQHRNQANQLFPAEVLLSSFKMGRRKVIQACVRDIRERVSAEADLRNSERRFRMLFERYADAVLLLDVRNNVFLDCNQAALELLRCTREELGSFGPPDVSPEFQPDGRPSLEKGREMCRIAIEQGSHRFQWMHQSPHREPFLVDVLMTPVEPGRSPLIFATWREIHPA